MKKLNVMDLIDAAVQDGTEECRVLDYLQVASLCIMKAQDLYTKEPVMNGQLFANMRLIQEMQNIKENASLFLETHELKKSNNE